MIHWKKKELESKSINKFKMLMKIRIMTKFLMKKLLKVQRIAMKLRKKFWKNYSNF